MSDNSLDNCILVHTQWIVIVYESPLTIMQCDIGYSILNQ